MKDLKVKSNLRRRRTSTHRPLLAFCATLLLTACSNGGGRGDDTARIRSPGDESRELAVAIDRSVGTLARTDWSSSVPNAGGNAKVSAFRDPQALRLVRERVELTPGGVMSNRYYFANGHLRYYESEGDVQAPDSTGKTVASRKQRVVLAFDIRGVLVEGSRQLDGETVAMDSAVARGAQARALELLRQEAKAPAAAPSAKKS